MVLALLVGRNHERSKDMQKYQKDIKSDKQYSRLILKEGACR